MIFIAGANTTETHPVFGASIKRAHQRGAKLIVADAASHRAGVPRRYPSPDAAGHRRRPVQRMLHHIMSRPRRPRLHREPHP